ncbi:MAG: FGGY-family carbohydrate kinase [Pseudomonadota bacterium]
MSLALGIDVGTSGVRTAVMDGDELVSMARTEHPEQDPDRIDANGWWLAVETCMVSQMEALESLGVDAKRISAIAVDGTSGSMVLTDGDVNPASPALMYNSKGFDAEAEEIAQHAPSNHIARGSNSALARALRLVKLSETAPKHLLHQADFIVAKLMNAGGHSDYNNTLKTGFDPETEQWPDWIGEVIDADLLPKVHAPGAALRQISAEVAAKFGLSEQAIVYAGTTDSIAAFLACASIEEGIAVTSLGSTLAVKLLSAKRIDDPAVGLYSHRLDDLWLVGGASNTGGAVLKQYFAADELDRLSNQIDPDNPRNLDFYPLLAPGERFPVNDPGFLPRLEPRPTDDVAFLQALLEGMAAIESQCYDAIAQRGGTRPRKVLTAGGGALNETWTAIRAKALNLKPITSGQSEAAVGVAKLAASGGKR